MSLFFLHFFWGRFFLCRKLFNLPNQCVDVHVHVAYRPGLDLVACSSCKSINNLLRLLDFLVWLQHTFGLDRLFNNTDNFFYLFPTAPELFRIHNRHLGIPGDAASILPSALLIPSKILISRRKGLFLLQRTSHFHKKSEYSIADK